MRNLPRSGHSPWCRSAQDIRATVRAFGGGASPEIRRLGSLAGHYQAAAVQQPGPADMAGAG
jgi:hypothetical protein